MLATLHLIALLFQRIQKCSKILELIVQQNVVDHSAELVTVAFFGRVERALLPLPVRLYLNDGQLVFQANQVAQPLHSKRGKVKIPKFPCTI